MKTYLDKLNKVEQYTGMFILVENIATLIAFIDGMNLASDGQLLNGFREWLLVRFNCGHNMTWSGIILTYYFPKQDLEETMLNPQNYVFMKKEIFSLLKQFLTENLN